jgi:hypothetical protein
MGKFFLAVKFIEGVEAGEAEDEGGDGEVDRHDALEFCDTVIGMPVEFDGDDMDRDGDGREEEEGESGAPAEGFTPEWFGRLGHGSMG